MAEPFSTIAAAISLGAEGVKLVKAIRTLVHEVRGASDEASATVKELESTVSVLDQFTKNVELEQANQVLFKNFFEEVQGTIKDCNDVFLVLRNTLERAIPGILDFEGDPQDFVARKRDSFKWPFIRPEIISTQNRLRRVKIELQLKSTVVVHLHLLEKERRRKKKAREATKQAQMESDMYDHQIKAIQMQKFLARRPLEAENDGTMDMFETLVSDVTAKKVDEAESLPNGAVYRSKPPQNVHFEPSKEQTPTSAIRAGDSYVGAPQNNGVEDRAPIGLIYQEQTDSHVPHAENAHVQPADAQGPQHGAAQTHTSDADQGQAHDPASVATVDPSSRLQPSRVTRWSLKNSFLGRSRPENIDRQNAPSVGSDTCKHTYKTFVACPKSYGEREIWEMPLTASESNNIVSEFNKKNKAILEYCAKLTEDQLDIIEVVINRCKKSDDVKHSLSWSLVAIKILPKRARGKEIKSLQIVLQGDQITDSIHKAPNAEKQKEQPTYRNFRTEERSPKSSQAKTRTVGREREDISSSVRAKNPTTAPRVLRALSSLEHRDIRRRRSSVPRSNSRDRYRLDRRESDNFRASSHSRRSEENEVVVKEWSPSKNQIIRANDGDTTRSSTWDTETKERGAVILRPGGQERANKPNEDSGEKSINDRLYSVQLPQEYFERPFHLRPNFQSEAANQEFQYALVRNKEKDAESLHSKVSGQSSLPPTRLDGEVAQYLSKYGNIDTATPRSESPDEGLARDQDEVKDTDLANGVADHDQEGVNRVHQHVKDASEDDEKPAELSEPELGIEEVS